MEEAETLHEEDGEGLSVSRLINGQDHPDIFWRRLTKALILFLSEVLMLLMLYVLICTGLVFKTHVVWWLWAPSQLEESTCESVNS